MARPRNSAETEAPADAEAENRIAGKGRPTPTRAEREAANRRPLVSGDRKGASKANRAKVAADRERARIGLANGEERYLPARDKGPQKRFVRDWMDARWSLGEAVLPLAVVVLISSALPVGIGQAVLFGVWAVFGIALIDFIVVGYRLNRKLAARFGAGKVERIRLYVVMRGIYPRFMRMPKPQVKRGQFPKL